MWLIQCSNFRMEQGVLIPTNEVVVCPGCFVPIARIAKELYTKDIYSLDHFEWLSFKYSYGDETKCDKCGEYWAVSQRLFIDGRGWVG